MNYTPNVQVFANKEIRFLKKGE